MTHPQTLSHSTSFSPLTNYTNIPYHRTAFIKDISERPGSCPGFNLIAYYEEYQKHKAIP